MRSTLRCLAIALALLAAPGARADSLLLGTLDRLGPDGYRESAATTYIVGTGLISDAGNASTSVELRNFLVFDLAAVTGWSITGTTLNPSSPVTVASSPSLASASGFAGTSPTGTLQLDPVATDAIALGDPLAQDLSAGAASMSITPVDDALNQPASTEASGGFAPTQFALAVARVDEPSTPALLAFTLLLLAVARRRA